MKNSIPHPEMFPLEEVTGEKERICTNETDTPEKQPSITSETEKPAYAETDEWGQECDESGKYVDPTVDQTLGSSLEDIEALRRAVKATEKKPEIIIEPVNAWKDIGYN